MSMAKSKRSRRVQSEQKQRPPSGIAAAEINSSAPTLNGTVEVAAQPRRKMVDFAQEYFYVYQEMRNILIVAIIMLLVMFGLSYFI
jgi:hypothetical protein